MWTIGTEGRNPDRGRPHSSSAEYCSLVAELASSGEGVREGNAALARGAWAEARAIFEQELEAHETVDALEGLSWAAWWVEDVATCLEARERAYRLSRREGDLRRAAMLALWVADDYLILRGERAIANGWFQRAARILEGLQTCPEHGWLDSLLGYVATVDGDPAKAKVLALQARELGRQLGVVSLEMFALAVEGLALVNEGEVADGMGCLDEATAAALAGEFEEIVAAGWTFCFLLNACERVRDYERAAEWCRKVEEFSRAMKTNFVTLACRAHYGAVLTWHGQWREAERSLTEATGLGAERPSWSGLAIVRLADLRRRQGRFVEAEELLQRAPGNALAPVVGAELALDQSDPPAAVRLLEPVLRRIPAENRTLRAAPIEVMVRAKLAAGDTEEAAIHLAELRSVADALGTRPLHASLSLCEGLVAIEAGDEDTARESSRTPWICSPRAAGPSSSRGHGSSWHGCMPSWAARTRPFARRRLRSVGSTRSGRLVRPRGLATFCAPSVRRRRRHALLTAITLRGFASAQPRPSMRRSPVPRARAGRGGRARA